MDNRKVAVHHPSHRDKQMVWDLSSPDSNLTSIRYIEVSVSKTDAYKAAFDDAFIDVDVTRWGFQSGVSVDDPELTLYQKQRVALLQGSSAVRNDVKLADWTETASSKNY